LLEAVTLFIGIEQLFQQDFNKFALAEPVQ